MDRKPLRNPGSLAQRQCAGNGLYSASGASFSSLKELLIAMALRAKPIGFRRG
jgi:hypothetical protein